MSTSRDVAPSTCRKSPGSIVALATHRPWRTTPSVRAKGDEGDSTVNPPYGDRAPATHEALAVQLDREREHVLAGIEGLGEPDLDLVVAPSGWTLRRMVTHLLYDVEVFWMGAVLGADPSAIARVCDGWSAPSISAGQLRQEYRAAASNGNRFLGEADLDAEPRWWPPADTFSGPRLSSSLEVVLRALTETATHAGHIDMARERLDGRQHLVVT